MQKAYWYHNVRTATSNSDPGYPEKVIIAWGIWTLTVWAFHIKKRGCQQKLQSWRKQPPLQDLPSHETSRPNHSPSPFAEQS